jgi:CheY-like chemotaxis protein
VGAGRPNATPLPTLPRLQPPTLEAFECGTSFAITSSSIGHEHIAAGGRGGKSGGPSGAERSGARRGPTLKGALERVGYDVVQAADAAGPLARLGAGPPDLIVLAGAVPDMELLDLCAALRREPAAEKIPFVLVAGAVGQTGRAASRAGADLVFPQTVGAAEIADRLRRLF